ncbi:MAG: hypothetical protein GY927_03855 [bacterium]|nr:hypothetical protein [bacterium]
MNPARSTQLIERGERKADAHIVARIIKITDGNVTAQDMHETRLEWLKQNKPEQFQSESAQ